MTRPQAGEPATFTVRAIGHVHSATTQLDAVRHTARGWTAETSRIHLLPKYAAGLGGLEGYSHVLVVFWIHRAGEWRMPRRHHKPPQVKVFATRMPVRPNPIGVSVVEVVAFSADTGEMVVRGLDAVDGTPVLDIKPYIPDFDSRADAQVPAWVAARMASHAHADSGAVGHGGGPVGS